jgi:uncharacterized RDD family membrane protein YckC
MEAEQIQIKDTYAGFWMRVVASFLDAAILAFLEIHMFWLFRDQLSQYFAAHPDALKMFQPAGDSDSSLYTDSYKLIEKFMYYYGTMIAGLFGWLYYAGFESSYLMATPGKKLLGLYVTNSDNQRISFGQATGRYFAKVISAVILGIGYLMAGFTERKQALHDTIANCLVWKK